MTITMYPVAGQSGQARGLHEVGHILAAQVGVGDLQVHRHHVGAETEEHALTEGEHSTAPPRQTDSDGDDTEAEVFAELIEPEVRQHARAIANSTIA